MCRITPPPICAHTHTASGQDYAEVHDPGSPILGRSFSEDDVELLDKIGEGQFGDVHKGVLYPDVRCVSVCMFVHLCVCDTEL